MATLPPLGSDNTVGVLISTRADDGAITTTQAQLQLLDKNINDLNNKSQSGVEKFASNMKNIGSQMTAVGRSLTTYVTLPIVGMGVAAAKMSSDFQTQMALVRTQAGDTTDNISQLSNEVLNLAKSSQFGPVDLAKGLYYVASFGYRGADAMKNLKAMADLATIGQANFEDTTRAVNAAMATGITGTQNLQDTIGTLNNIVGVGAMRMDDLVAAMGTGFLEQAKIAGLSLSDVGAALATMTDTGQNADAAATHIRMALSLIENPSKKAQGALEAIGLTSTSLAEEMRSKGLIPALQELQKHLTDTYGKTDEGKNKIAQALGDMFGGGRSSIGVETLLDQLSRVQQKSLSTAQAGSQVAASLKTMESTPGFQMKESWSKIQVALIELGDKILPIVVPAIAKLAGFVDDLASRFEKLSKPAQTAILAFAGIAAVAGPLLIFFGTLVTAIGAIAALSAPVLITIGVIAGLALLAPLIIANWGKVKDFFGSLWKGITDIFHTVTKAIGDGMDWLGNHWVEVIGYMIGFFATLPIKLPLLMVEAIVKIFDYLKHVNWGDVFKLILDDFKGQVNFMWDAMKWLFDQITHLDWGKVFSFIVKSNVNTIIDLLNGVMKGAFSGIPIIGNHVPQIPRLASGTNYARGGWSMVGENGPEMMYVPRGSQVLSSGQSSMTNSNNKTSVSIGQVVLPSAASVTEFFRQLDQDTLNIGKGLTTNRGLYA